MTPARPRAPEVRMYVAYVPLATFVAHVVAVADEAPCAAMVIPFVRAADGNWPDVSGPELWRSLHDVTGSALWVVCPSDDPQRLQRARDELHGARGLVLAPLRPPELRLRNVEIGRKVVFSAAAGREGVAWATDTSDLAWRFGIAEAQLPCLLFVDLVGRRMCALALPGRTTIYDACKGVVQALGDGPARMRAAARASDGAREVHYKIRRTLEVATDGRDNLVRHWRSIADRLRATDATAYGSAAALLEAALDDGARRVELLATLPGLRADLATRHGTARLGRSLCRVEAKLAHRPEELPPPGPWLDELRDAERAAATEVADARRRAQEARKGVDVAGAVEQVAVSMFGRTRTAPIVSEDLPWPGVWHGPRDPSVHHPALRYPAPPRRAAVAGAATAVVSVVVAVFVNYATAEGSGPWPWVLAAVLTVLVAGVTYVGASRS